jgi:hypothetical protein
VNEEHGRLHMEKRELVRNVICHEGEIAAPAEKIFPLLCPVREYEWLDGWSCRLVYSKSGFAEMGAVFTTELRAEEGASIWTVSRYEPDRAIEFVVVLPGVHVMTMAISLNPLGPGRTHLTWTFVFTSLTGPNVAFDEASFERDRAFIDRALEHYCREGNMLRRE